MPRRLQIRRGEGWRLPANTLKVDRSSLCGNPFLAIELGDDRAIVRLPMPAAAPFRVMVAWRKLLISVAAGGCTRRAQRACHAQAEQ